MQRIAVSSLAVAVIMLGAGGIAAGGEETANSGYQPWYNINAKRYKCSTPEEERLQKFWHDYYDAMKNYYGALDRIDWVAYYKNHGYQVNDAGCGACGCPNCRHINYAPVFVAPTMRWCLPNGAIAGPPVGPAVSPTGPPPSAPGR